MAEQVRLDSVITSIMCDLVGVIDEQKRLEDAKMILYMNLHDLQIFKEETALSVDVDRTEEYLKDYLLQMKLDGCTQGSIDNYRCNLRTALDYINKNILDIAYQDLRGYLAYGKLVREWKDRTYNSKLICLRSFFGWLYEEDMLPNNPAKKLKETKVERKIGPTLKPEQREEVRCACESELELALCDMLYTSGARVSELVALNRKDIDFYNMKAIVYGKGRREREVYFTGQAKVHLERYLEARKDENEALFVNPNKTSVRITDQVVRNILKKIKSRDADLESVVLTPHVFRRSVGTDMINKGAPLELVAEKLGHVQLDTTKQCYAAIAKATVQQAHVRYV